MIKFEHSIFALPFAYAGLFLAVQGFPSLHDWIWITGAMVSFRTSAMAMNRLFDQEIDGRNPRTRERALPAGHLRRSFVWVITAVSLLLFAYCAYQLSPLCLKLSWIPIVLSAVYPFCKRFTWGSHFLLGSILGMAPYGAWLGAGREFSWIPGLMMVGVALWVAGFDILYALQDREFDVQAGLYSMPACFGEELSLKLTPMLHAGAFICWGLSGILANLGILYYLGLLLTGALLIWENRMMRRFGLARLQQAFFTLNAVISFSLFVFLALDVIF